MNTPSLTEMARRCERLPSLPKALIRALEIMESDSADVAEAAAAIEHDPALTAQTLKLANSAAFGGLGIISIKEAIVRIGWHELWAIIITAEVSRAFQDIPSTLFNMPRFWRHAVLTACIARELTQDIPPKPTVFVCGMLHDIGQLLLAIEMPKQYAPLLAEKNLTAAEQRELGYTHADVGAALLKHWQLPDVIIEAVAGHHKKKVCKICDLINLADLIAADQYRVPQTGLDIEGATARGRQAFAEVKAIYGIKE